MLLIYNTEYKCVKNVKYTTLVSDVVFFKYANPT